MGVWEVFRVKYNEYSMETPIYKRLVFIMFPERGSYVFPENVDVLFYLLGYFLSIV